MKMYTQKDIQVKSDGISKKRYFLWVKKPGTNWPAKLFEFTELAGAIDANFETIAPDYPINQDDLLEDHSYDAETAELEWDDIVQIRTDQAKLDLVMAANDLLREIQRKGELTIKQF